MMYSDHKRRRRGPAVLIGALLLTAVLVRAAMPAVKADVSEESAAAVKAAIEKSARQCYAIEGAYPSGYGYLEENYGLTVNTKDFYVIYEVFASNVAPEIRVVPRETD